MTDHIVVADDQYKFYEYDGWEHMPSAPALDRALDDRIAAYGKFLQAIAKHGNVTRAEHDQFVLPARDKLREARSAHIALEAQLMAECEAAGLRKFTDA